MAAGAEPWLRTRLVAANAFVAGLESDGEKGSEVEAVGGRSGLREETAMDRRSGRRGWGRGHRSAAGEGRPPWTRQGWVFVSPPMGM